MAIQWTVEEGIGRLMMDQPPSNTMTIQFFTEFRHWIDIVLNETGLKAIIIHGNGRHFSSGADLKELLFNLDRQIMVDNYRSLQCLNNWEFLSFHRSVAFASALLLNLHCSAISGFALTMR